MLEVNAILEILNDIAPFDTAEEWDNVGLLLGEGHQYVKKVLLALDLSEPVINEAVRKECDLIITHHPFIFKSIKRITNEDRLGKSIIKLLKNNIAVISAHTNLDQAFENGINYNIGNLYNLSHIEPLSVHHGFGVIGSYATPLAFSKFIHLTKEIFNIQHVKVVNSVHVETHGINRIAICSGSASDYIKDAMDAYADVYITSDLKYHEAQVVLDSNLMLVDVGHFESEVLFLPEFKNIISNRLSQLGLDLEIFVSESEYPLFNYY